VIISWRRTTGTRTPVIHPDESLTRWGASAGGTAALDFEAALTATLKADASLTAIVGQRIYPHAIPQKGQLPALVYAIPNTTRVRNFSGPAAVAVARVLFDCRSNAYGDTKVMQEALRRYDRFDGFLAESVYVMNAVMADQAGEYEWPAGTGTDQGTYHLTVEFSWKYREPTAS
jgi:hypothetical protein